ncbi:hypothetical protein [Demequina sp.]|uniref:hypothetical protein n=1 Tax=Demequina sp. TaxID=2050685 RepID=UPI003D10DCEC
MPTAAPSIATDDLDSGQDLGTAHHSTSSDAAALEVATTFIRTLGDTAMANDEWNATLKSVATNDFYTGASADVAGPVPFHRHIGTVTGDGWVERTYAGELIMVHFNTSNGPVTVYLTRDNDAHPWLAARIKYEKGQ